MTTTTPPENPQVRLTSDRLRDLLAADPTWYLTPEPAVASFPADQEKATAKSAFPVTPFPQVLPEYLQQLVTRYAAALQCSEAFVATIFMTVASGAIGNSVTVAVKNSWRTAVFIWLCVVDLSGAGKSHPIEAGMAHIKALQGIEQARYDADLLAYQAEMASYKNSKSAATPPKEPEPPRHYYTQNFTIEALIPMYKRSARGIVAFVDELAGLLKGLNQYKGGKGSDDENFLSLYNCKELKSDRAAKNGFSRESGVASIGGIQPLIFDEVFDEKSAASGMLYRWMPLVLNSTPPDFSDDDLADDDTKEWSDVLDWLYGIKAEIDVKTGYILKQKLTLEPSGREAFRQFHNELSHIQPFLAPRFAGHLPKMKDYCLKFMGVLHCLECYQDKKLFLQISKTTVDKAILLTRYFLGQALELSTTASVRKNPFHAALRKAIDSLRCEAENGKLLVSRIRERMNELLPPAMMIADTQNKKIVTWLDEIGIQTTTRADNKTVAIII